MGEAKTPDALRNSSDQFFQWSPHETEVNAPVEPAEKPVARAAVMTAPQPPKDPQKPAPKLRPKFVVEAVALLAGDIPDGRVSLGLLGQYLKRTDPAFSPKIYRHSGLLDMVHTYDLLALHHESGGHWMVAVGLLCEVWPPLGRTVSPPQTSDTCK